MDLQVTPEAQENINGIRDDKKLRKVNRCLAKLAADPAHPGLHSHRYQLFDEIYGQSVWESYVENETPSAWRVWWAFGPDRGQITILMVGPHP